MQVVCGVAFAGFAARAAAQALVPVQERLMPLEVTINNAAQGNWVLLERMGVLHAPEEALNEWRIHRPDTVAGVVYRGQTWYPLASFPGFKEQRNWMDQSIDLSFSPTVFAATQLSSALPLRSSLTPVTPAMFFNYDVNAVHMTAKSVSATREIGALTEWGFSGSSGVLTSSYVARQLTGADVTLSSSWRRLETTATRDFPDRNVTVRLGDTITRGSLSGRAAYFGGLQIARNFALTPGFVSQPIPSIAGVSRAPSTLALYINDVLRQTSSVPAGPFAIDNVPLLNGAGEARVVVRDLLGRETVLTQRFFTDPTLLAPGLSDWSMEVGALRHDLGVANARYGDRFTSGAIRYGMSRALTVEGHAQLSKRLQEAGLGINVALPWQMLAQAALAYSRHVEGARGYEGILGAEHNDQRHGFSVRAQIASRPYRQLGLDADVLPQRLALSASYAYASEQFGSLSLGLARVQSHDNTNFMTYSANYTKPIGKGSSLTLSATRVTGNKSGTSFGLAFIAPLEGHVIASGSVSGRSGQPDGYVSASRGLSTEVGLGWRTQAGIRAGAAYSEGGMYYQASKMLLTGDIHAAAARQTVRLGAVGGLVLMEGRLFSSRRVQDSFALVEVPGYPDVGVGFQGSSLTRTDDNGMALLPRLLAYQRNSIRLNPGELPINAELDTIEQVAVPPTRSGVKVVFPVRAGRGALIKIVFDDGEPAPAGAELELVGDKKEFFVARRGEAFITGLAAHNTVRLRWNGRSCSFAVDLPSGKSDDIARLGPITCADINR